MPLPKECAGERLRIDEVRDGEVACAIRRDESEGLDSGSTKRIASAFPVSLVVGDSRPRGGEKSECVTRQELPRAGDCWDPQSEARGLGAREGATVPGLSY